MNAVADSSVPQVDGLTLWLTGLPSAGKTTIANSLAQKLRPSGRRVEVLDGDVLRQHLSADLGYSRIDRDANVRRVGFIANLLSRNGVIAVCSLISPYRDVRDEVRSWHDGRFVEIFVDTPLALCEQRDVKGLYARQRRGDISNLTGIDDPYERPERPEVTIRTAECTEADAAEMVLRVLREAGRLH